MSTQPSDMSGFMIGILVLFFLMISYCVGVMVHSALMYEDKNNIEHGRRDRHHRMDVLLRVLYEFFKIGVFFKATEDQPASGSHFYTRGIPRHPRHSNHLSYFLQSIP